MKKILTLLALITFLFNSQAQTKKKAPLRLTEIQQVKKDALYWFKNVFVETNFKDPYSYKLLKCDVYPATYKEVIERAVSRLDTKLYMADTSKSYSDYGKAKGAYLRTIKYNERYGAKDTSDVKYVNQRKAENANRALMEIELMRYTDLINEMAALKDEVKSLSSVNANKVVQYSVYLDCYSNNSYGNPVLGKFAFDYSKAGLVREPIQLNSED